MVKESSDHKFMLRLVLPNIYVTEHH